MLENAVPDWTVLVIGGSSGVGKSIAAKRIARRFGADWLQVDDLRLALEASRVTLPDPDDSRNLSFFHQPNVWQLPPEQLLDGFIGVGKAMTPAIVKIMSNHLALNDPIVLEGDGLLPSLLTHPDLDHWHSGRHIKAVFVASSEEREIRANMLARGRGIADRPADHLIANVRASWLFGRWLATEARRCGLPVVESQPWETLVDRIVIASRTVVDPSDEIDQISKLALDVRASKSKK